MVRLPEGARATSGRPRVGPPSIGVSRLATPAGFASLFTIWVVLLVVATPARSARQIDLDLDELLYRSALVFEGVVTEVDIAAGDKAARTRVRFAVARVLRGQIDRDALTFEVPEGELPDGRLVETVETPRFAQGERYIVFVRGGPWRLSPVLDWHQGVLRLTTVGGYPIAVTDGGHCIADIDRVRMHQGPRVAARLQWPGFPTTTGADPPDADAANKCLSSSAVVHRLEVRIDELGLRGPAIQPVRFGPVDDVRSTPTARPGSR